LFKPVGLCSEEQYKAVPQRRMPQADDGRRRHWNIVT